MNAVLAPVFGSKDVSRAVAGRTAEQTGIGADILKRLLPVAAAMLMGGLSKQSAASTNAPGSGDLLTSLLDRNRNGSVADDVVGLLGRFLCR